MHITRLYKCLSDTMRLRILNLLQEGPLCVCHLMEILGCDQIKMSKQLRYMKELGIVEGERQAQWVVYRLADAGAPLLAGNLKCLRSGAGKELPLGADLEKRRVIMDRLREEPTGCSEALLSEQAACCG